LGTVKTAFEYTGWLAVVDIGVEVLVEGKIHFVVGSLFKDAKDRQLEKI